MCACGTLVHVPLVGHTIPSRRPFLYSSGRDAHLSAWNKVCLARLLLINVCCQHRRRRIVSKNCVTYCGTGFNNNIRSRKAHVTTPNFFLETFQKVISHCAVNISGWDQSQLLLSSMHINFSSLSLTQLLTMVNTRCYREWPVSVLQRLIFSSTSWQWYWSAFQSFAFEYNKFNCTLNCLYSSTLDDRDSTYFHCYYRPWWRWIAIIDLTNGHGVCCQFSLQALPTQSQTVALGP
jgi:hypothetical protein